MSDGHRRATADQELGSVDQRLRQATEAVYRVFRAPPPAVIKGCPCCIETRGTDELLSSPLRDLSGQTLWRYVSGLFLTVGDEPDFRYLLPRILDVAANDPGNSNDPEIVLGKLQLTKWRRWSSEEQSAVATFVDAWFERALATDAGGADEGWIGSEAESVLCGAARAGMSLERWLIRLLEPDAAPVLADLRQRYPGELSAFWEYAPAGLHELSAILVRGRT